MSYQENLKAAVRAVAGLSPAERETLLTDPGAVLAVAAYLQHANRAALEAPGTRKLTAYRWTSRYGMVRTIHPSEIEAIYTDQPRRRFRDSSGDVWLENERGTFDCLLDENHPGQRFHEGCTNWSLSRLRSAYSNLAEIKS